MAEASSAFSRLLPYSPFQPTPPPSHRGFVNLTPAHQYFNLSMNEAQHFRFFDLPAEIREYIYEAFFESEPTFVTRFGAQPPPLLLSNRSVYKEAIDIFWSTSEFWFSSAIDGYKWYRKLNPKLRVHVTRTRCASPEPVEDMDPR